MRHYFIPKVSYSHFEAKRRGPVVVTEPLLYYHSANIRFFTK